MNFVEGIMLRLRNDYDAVIALTGEPGDGKSTLMQNLGFKIDKNFDQRKNISYIPTVEDIQKRFNALEPYQVFCIDEAIEVLYKNDYMSNLQKTLIKMYNRERKQNKATILCIPSFADLSKSFRNSRVKYWIYVVERGHGVLMCRPKTPFTDDAWLLKKFDKIFNENMDKKKATLTSDEIIDIMKRSPLFVDEIYFDDLPDDKKDIYRDCVTHERDKFYASEEGQAMKESKRERSFSALVYNLHEDYDFSLRKLEMLANYHISARAIGDIVNKQQKSDSEV